MGTVLILILAIWAACGVAIAAALSRYGHNFWLLAFIGLGYGPFLSLIFVLGLAGQQSATTRAIPGGIDGPNGWIDVVIGLDGTDTSIDGIRPVFDTLGSAVRRVAVVSVLDHEISNTLDGFELDDARWQFLQRAAIELGAPEATVALLRGQPDKALSHYADEEGFDLVLVGHTHHPIVSTLRGSTTARLARTAGVPVLIGPAV